MIKEMFYWLFEVVYFKFFASEQEKEQQRAFDEMMGAVENYLTESHKEIADIFNGWAEESKKRTR